MSFLVVPGLLRGLRAAGGHASSRRPQTSGGPSCAVESQTSWSAFLRPWSTDAATDRRSAADGDLPDKGRHDLHLPPVLQVEVKQDTDEQHYKGVHDKVIARTELKRLRDRSRSSGDQNKIQRDQGDERDQDPYPGPLGLQPPVQKHRHQERCEHDLSDHRWRLPINRSDRIATKSTVFCPFLMV